jgi:RNA polymerase sigma factor (TIGR02999 family)
MERKSSAGQAQITQLLHQVRQGDHQAESRLIALVYPSLWRLAHHFMRAERQGHTLQATALVNECYLRLAGNANGDWRDRAHFFAVAARMMRRILADHARKRCADRRGGRRQQTDFTDSMLAAGQDLDSILEIDDLLSRLEQVDRRLCRVVELRYFVGLTEEETAEVLAISAVSVRRDWRLAKAWLFQQLKRPAASACAASH